VTRSGQTERSSRATAKKTAPAGSVLEWLRRKQGTPPEAPEHYSYMTQVMVRT
jgi:hypothetical protein